MNKGFKKHIVFQLFVVLLSGSLFAQKPEAALNAFSSKLLIEKMYIHYDKEYYVAGETIWFKAYLYRDGKPSSISSNFYLQFIDSKGRLVAARHFPVMGAVAKGNIEIPDSLPQGNYYIRALTPVMLNGSEDFIYHKNIFIHNPKSAATGNAEPQNISLNFFPESGQMIHGILTTVAFKAADQWGIPFEAHGIIKTDENTTVAPFHSYHDGIGKLQFKPIAGKKYRAELETPAGIRTYPLPEVNTSGINLKVQDEKGGKKFQLSRVENKSGEFATVKLVVQVNNQVVNEIEVDFEDYPSVVGHLKTDSLPSGILHLTVFNKDWIPLAERLVFVDNSEYKSNATLNTVKVGTGKRAENIIEINFEEAVQRSCSVSVIELPSQSFNDDDNIWSRFLLTADLKGKINNPAWYFQQANDSTGQGIDNLLLTHGWSRFNWTKILNSELPEPKYRDQNLLVLSGIVADEKTKEPLSYGQLNIFLESEDSSTQTFELPLDSKGVFRKDSVLFFGKAKLFYSYIDKNGKQNPGIVILDDNSINFRTVEFIPKEAMISGNAKNSASNNKEEIEKRHRFVQSRLDEIKELERVTVQAKASARPIDIVNEKYTSGVFRSMGKVNIDNINNPPNDRSMNAIDFIKNRIQQLEIQGGSFVNRKNISLVSGQKWLVGIFLDEYPANMGLLRVLRADDIALVKFYEAGFVGVGSGSPGGALAVYTKEKSNKDEKPEKLEFVEYKGYSVIKEFYQPDYNTSEPRHSLADNRTTLYWNPDVYTDKESKSVKVNFFNNDFSKRFKIVVEGFDAAGKLVHQEKIIEE